jgi:DNA invertase Pin-like site-specific DNA recombinase
MTKAKPLAPKIRCAIYTRKSTEEGLDMEFTSLDAQREACEAYVASQRAEGWVLVPDRYDDGGFSGGNLKRPALERLLSDVGAGLIDAILVYKNDRLSRATRDFLNLLDLFERRNVSFVSVTQSFHTKDPAGRLFLNIMVSFGEFERGIIGERIRDKIAASRKKGIWMGGWAPFGYIVKDRKLVVKKADADVVRSIFQRFVTLRSATLLARELKQKNVRNNYGRPINKGGLYKLLSNRTYVGEAVHKGTAYPGEHKAIIDRKLWDRVHAILQESPRARAATSRATTPALLKGLIFDASGTPMSPTHTRRKGRLYRYYTSQKVIKGEVATTDMRVPAGEIEEIVIGQLRRMIAAPEVIVATWKQLRRKSTQWTERSVRGALLTFDEVWADLFPTEQSRILNLLVSKVTVAPAKVDVHLRIDGFSSLASDLQAATMAPEAA